MSRSPDFVAERLAHGALCHVCPLNGQRKVGHDGPPPEDAHVFAIVEAPGSDEETYGISRGLKHGRVLTSKTGYFWKLEQLTPAGLAQIEKRKGGSRWPEVKGTDVHVMPLVMCRIPKDKIESVIGKQATRCCANSARWFLNEYVYGEKRFPLEPEEDVYRYVLRGKKPTEVWWPEFETWLKGVIKFHRKIERAAEKQRAKAEEARVLADNPWLVEWTKLYKKQLAAMRRAAKKEAGQ